MAMRKYQRTTIQGHPAFIRWDKTETISKKNPSIKRKRGVAIFIKEDRLSDDWALLSVNISKYTDEGTDKLHTGNMASTMMHVNSKEEALRTARQLIKKINRG